MSFDFDLNAILGQIGRDKGIDRAVLIEAIESAMLSAARKHYGHNLNLETRFNDETGEIEVLEFKTVVDRVEDESTEITLEQARKDFDSEAMVGDELGRKLDTRVLGRIAAQTAKQVIMQKVRDAERNVIFEEFKNSKGDLINGIVQRYDRGDLIVNLGRTEAMLPKREQIQRERYRQGDRLRCMILDIDRSARGPQIILTRSHPDFLKKLFELEVPEIAEKVVEIKACAREPGERAKIAVSSSDSGVDPVGACVGIKGSRVQAVVQELRGERIDIITWTPDEPSFVARALSPAEVVRVLVDEEDHGMEVIVPDDQLSLAIGRRGQNVKLASKLTGWRLDVRSVTVAEEESKRARKALEAIPGIEFTQAEMLFQAGYRKAREVADATVEELAEIDTFSPESASVVLQKAKEYVAQLDESGEQEASEESSAVSDLGRLALSPEVKELLLAGGFTAIQGLVAASAEEILAIEGIGEPEYAMIRDALESFLRNPPRILINPNQGGAA
ncbi:MAG: transcription termination/antitermination protein NusA [Proteobacteria bacterium]|nr:transcription termination/antitermination protein NusA [Pseudomonadota bacterium]